MQVIERKCIVHKLTLTETDTVMCTHAPRSYAHTSLFINTKIVSCRYIHCVSLPLPSFFHLVIPHLQHTRRLFTLQTVAANEKPLNVGHFFLISSTPRLTPLPTCLSRRSTRPRLITFG